jgi:hypothetical protein
MRRSSLAEFAASGPPTNLTMRLSDAGIRCRETQLVYLNRRLPPWFNEDTPTRDRSNRLLDVISRAHNLRTGDDKLANASV